MGVAGHQLCMALDPLPSLTGGGREVHRHCLLVAGHDGPHESRNMDGTPVHRWDWIEDGLHSMKWVQELLF